MKKRKSGNRRQRRVRGLRKIRLERDYYTAKGYFLLFILVLFLSLMVFVIFVGFRFQGFVVDGDFGAGVSEENGDQGDGIEEIVGEGNAIDVESAGVGSGNAVDGGGGPDEGVNPQPNPPREVSELPSGFIFNGTANAEANFKQKENELRKFYFFNFIDSILGNTSVVSRIFFGVYYDFSLRYWLSAVFWLLFLVFTPGMIRGFSGLGRMMATLFAFLLNIVLAQIFVFKGLGLLTIGLISGGEFLGIVLFLILLVVLLTMLIGLSILARRAGKKREEMRVSLAGQEKKISVGGKFPEEDYQAA